MKPWQSLDTRKTAQTLPNAIALPTFIISMIVLDEISSMILPAVQTLQTIGLDVVTAIQITESLLEAFVPFCHEEVLTKLFIVAEAIVASLNIEIRRPRIPQRSSIEAIVDRPMFLENLFQVS